MFNQFDRGDDPIVGETVDTKQPVFQDMKTRLLYILLPQPRRYVNVSRVDLTTIKPTTAKKPAPRKRAGSPGF
jgi:hypothetical protein